MCKDKLSVINPYECFFVDIFLEDRLRGLVIGIINLCVHEKVDLIPQVLSRILGYCDFQNRS